jgi:hypothetical protein
MLSLMVVLQDRFDRADPRETARRIALARVAIGATLVLLPRLATRPALRAGGPSDEAVLFARMAGGRDLVLGAGVLLAERRRPESVRGWVEAGAAADAIDVIAFGLARGLKGWARGLSLLVAAGATAVGVATAQRLGE